MRWLLALPLLIGLIGCSEQTFEDQATGFITENPIAINESSEMARDDYGRPFGYALLGQALPEFELFETNSAKLTHHDFLGQWTIIDVWGLWCSDCLADADLAAKLKMEVDNYDWLDMVSIHTPPSQSRKTEAYGKYGSLEAFFATKDYQYTVAVDHDAKWRDKMQIIWTPSYLLVDPEGIVRGYRSDLSAAGDMPILDFINDVKIVRKQNTMAGKNG